jgi:hypothetical protein
MNELYRRWFEPPSIQTAVSSMLRKFGSVPRSQSENVQRDRGRLQKKYTMIAAGGAVVFLIVVIGVLSFFAPQPKEKQANYGGLALLSLVVVAGAGAAAYFTCGNNNRIRAERDGAFEQLCRRHPGLRPARRTEIEGPGVGTVPWFHSEEWIHTYGLASGEYEGVRLIAVECTHVVDPILVTTDSRFVQGLAGLASSRHKRLFLRAMDATIFVEPLPNVSDLLFVPRMDPSRAYYKQALEKQDCDLADVYKLPRALRRKYWMAAAEPEECGGLFATELPALLASRKWCIVQVVGGYCVVLTSQWHGNYPRRAPHTAEAIADDLAFAHAVYRQLRRFSTAGDDMSSVAEYESEAVATAAVPMGEASIDVGDRAEPTPISRAAAEEQASFGPRTERSVEPATAAHAASAPTRRKRRRRPHSILAKLCLFGFGIPLFLFGLLGTIAFSVNRQRGLTAGSWPQAEARVTDSGMDVQTRHRNGQEVMQFKPRVSYEYEVGGQQFTGNRIQYGVASATMNKHEADRVLARYPKDAAVKVHYVANRPEVSVLEPGLQEESKLIVYLWVTGALTLLGFLMNGYAVIGKRVCGNLSRETCGKLPRTWAP